MSRNGLLAAASLAAVLNVQSGHAVPQVARDGPVSGGASSEGTASSNPQASATAAQTVQELLSPGPADGDRVVPGPLPPGFGIGWGVAGAAILCALICSRGGGGTTTTSTGAR